ncbi:MAG: NADH-quinone oxidoreductase subunit NuoB [Myxococcota bacterium]
MSAAETRSDLRARPTRLEAALEWAQGLAPSTLRIASSCCGMAMVAGGDPFEALGAGPPAVSARAADLLVVAGPITRRQAPLLQGIYERMLEPRWVIAWGACAISGGPYRNYATVPGLATLLPVDLVVPGCPPEPTAIRDALEQLRSGRARRPADGARSSRDPSDWPILREDGPVVNGRPMAHEGNG